MPEPIKHSHMVSPAHAAASAAARAAPLNFSTPETPMSEDPSALTPAVAQASAPVASVTTTAPNTSTGDAVDGATKIGIAVYIDDGNVFEYDVDSPTSAREHVTAIINTGYRRIDGDTFTHYGPHRVVKVKAKGPGITTLYPDRPRGT
jgi:hypothetical protein